VSTHILHRWPAQILYLLLAVLPRTRLVGLGLVIHVLLDALDCLAIASSEGG
jgi:hypothetical protein